MWGHTRGPRRNGEDCHLGRYLFMGIQARIFGCFYLMNAGEDGFSGFVLSVCLKERLCRELWS